jgi:HEXXH motif-containing protein
MSAPARLPPPVDLTLPGPGSRITRQLLSLALLQARSIALSLTSAAPLDPRAALRRGVPTADAGFWLAALRRPSRLTLARCIAHDTASPARSGWSASLAAWLCLDAAEAGALSGEVEFSTSQLLSERSGWVATFPPGTRLRLSAHRIEAQSPQGVASSELPATVEQLTERLRPAGAQVQLAHVPVWGDTVLLLHDSNPLASQEAHPDKSGNLVDLGGHPAQEWVDALRAALELIEDVLPEIAGEMRLLLGHLGPVGYFDQKHLSASFLESVGVVYLSLHPHQMTLVEALVHEFQHNKLNLLLGLDPTLHNADWPLFSSPVRPDPRPLRGVLLAVHAFQPIVKLYERLCERPATGEGEAAWRRRRLGEVARLCREGCEVLLPSAKPTPHGTALLDEIRRLDDAFRPLAVAP